MGIEGAVSMDQSLIDAVNSLSQLTAVQWVQLVMLVVIAGLLWTTIRQMGVVSNVLDVMKSQQKSSDKHEDKLAAAIERFPDELNKVGQALLLINRGVDGARVRVEDTQTNILARLTTLSEKSEAALLGETSDIKTSLQDIYELIERLGSDVTDIKVAANRVPALPQELKSQLDIILGYVEAFRPKLKTGTYDIVPAAVINGLPEIKKEE